MKFVNKCIFVCQLLVLVSPKIILSPKSKVLQVGSNTKLYCTAFGEPVPEVQWLHNNQIISPVYQIMTHAGSSQLVIKNVQMVDAGEYRCLFQNIKNTTVTKSATLSVFSMINILISHILIRMIPVFIIIN